MADIHWYLNGGEKSLSAVDLMIHVLAKLNTTVFDELVKISGKAESLAAVKPYRMSNGPYMADMARKLINVQGNGPDALLLAYSFASTSVVPSDLITGEVKERGAVGTHRECLFKNASPEFCMSNSHFNSESLAEYMNPDYECIWTHHQSYGDECCRYVFKKKSDPFSVLDDLGKTLVVLPKFEVPKEQNQAASLWALAAFLFGTTMGFSDLHGTEETNEILGLNAKKIGQEVGAWLAENNAELRDDPPSMAALVRSMYSALGQKDNFTSKSNELFSNDITDCSQQQWGCEMCKQYEALFNGMVGAISPDYEFFYDRMIPRGDKTCHWVVRKKGEQMNEVQDDGSKETALELLKKRLVIGEIKEEEYKRLKALIEE